MISVTLPDGSIKQFDQPISGLELAGTIGEGLKRAALAMKINGQLQDLTDLIDSDCNISIITARDEEGLEIIRHDTAHIIAHAVKELFPETQITIGPVIENGFYYDFSRKTPFTNDDLIAIEQRMKEIVKRDIPIVKETWKRDEAVKFFKEQGEFYKAEIIASIPETEDIRLYRQGDFIDLCRGPHAPTTGKAKAFKLTKIAGAYWRGNSNNEMLQRIYGTAWNDEKQLKEYLLRLEEAEKRDHRKLGKQLGLFHIQEEAVGQIFWHPKGWVIYRALENYIRTKIEKNGYVEVKTPILADRSIWEASGHWEKFGENMFIVEAEDKTLAIKPMNCPLHIQIFNQNLHSYRDLPLRMAEFGCCHRNESSGSMHGLMRVRGFAQDDAHIFCTENDIEAETVKFTKLLLEVYKELGFEEVRIKFSDRPEKRAGTDETWDKAEAQLKQAVEATGLPYIMNHGEGAFYGPKLEFVLKDAIGRDWQCGTLQVDFVLPERLDANYIGSDGAKHRPVMIHRAILGSLERFLGILIEQYAGSFPLWLSPVQVMVTTITNESDEYADNILEKLKSFGVRAEIDKSNEKINYKIRQHSHNKIPIILAVGKQEMAQNTVSVRKFGSNDTEIINFDEFCKELIKAIVAPN